MNRGTLVCLTGLDGAGKSTLTGRVVEQLQEDGYDVTRAYGRYLPKLAYPIMELGRRTVFSDSDIEADYGRHQSSKNTFFSSRILATLYEGLLMVDYAPQFIYRVVLPLYRSDIVVCDRYFYDTLLTDMAGDLLKTPSEAVAKYRQYQNIVPTPDHEFYIRVPIEVSMERKDDIPSKAYLQDRKAFYDTFAEEFGLTVLDGTESLDALVADVVERIT